VRHWKRWNLLKRQPIFRPVDPLTASLPRKCAELWVLLRFVYYLLFVVGVAPPTAMQYLGTTNAWHRRRTLVGLAADMPFDIISEMARGAARIIVRPARPPRFGMPPQSLAVGMQMVLGRRGFCSRTAQNIRAGLATTFATLSRGCEMFGRSGKPHDPHRDPLRSDLAPSGGAYSVAIHEAKRCTLTGVAPGKRTRLHVPRGGVLLDPAAELDALLAVDPAPPSAPLFRDATTGAAISVEQIRAVVKSIAHAVGLNPANFGAHSLRCRHQIPTLNTSLLV
jgi:hypothetical protein